MALRCGEPGVVSKGLAGEATNDELSALDSDHYADVALIFSIGQP
jgi:hypothetical protein